MCRYKNNKQKNYNVFGVFVNQFIKNRCCFGFPKSENGLPKHLNTVICVWDSGGSRGCEGQAASI